MAPTASSSPESRRAESARALIEASLARPFVVLAAATLLLIVGTLWVVQLPVDIFPDLSAPTVTILTEALPTTARRWIGRLIDVVVLAFAAFLLWLAWGWYDLPTLAAMCSAVISL